jgi:acetylornithine/succinyldiaminopimelate/putrescine aminotransferase
VENGFAGRTMGALSVTHDPHYRDPFLPLIGPVTFVDPEPPETLLAAVTDKTAAIIAEPIRGERRHPQPARGFRAGVKDVTAKTGTLLIADEVQSGLGRTGYGFYSRRSAGSPISSRSARRSARACPWRRR